MSVNKDELEKNLSINIGLIGKYLHKAGYSSSDIDSICNEAFALIQNRAEQITDNNPLQTRNVENIIIMVLMHGAIMSQKECINHISKSLNVDVETIEDEIIIGTMGKS